MPAREFYEYLDTLDFKYTANGGTATRRFCVKADKFNDYLSVMTAPIPSHAHLVCVEISGKYVGGHTQVGNTREWIDVTSQYATATNDDEWTSTIDYDIDLLNIGRGRTWASDGKLVDDVGQTVPFPKVMESLEGTISGSIPIANIKAVLGTINAYTFRGYAGESMLLAGARSFTKWDIYAGTWKQKLVYRFHHFSINPNYVWRESIGDYDRMVPDLFGVEDWNLYLGIL